MTPQHDFLMLRGHFLLRLIRVNHFKYSSFSLILRSSVTLPR